MVDFYAMVSIIWYRLEDLKNKVIVEEYKYSKSTVFLTISRYIIDMYLRHRDCKCCHFLLN